MQCLEQKTEMMLIPIFAKAELLREGIIFLIHLFARAILLMKKLKIEETKATFKSIQLLKVGLFFRFPTFSLIKLLWQIYG